MRLPWQQGPISMGAIGRFPVPDPMKRFSGTRTSAAKLEIEALVTE